ncbi:hypothetical protein D3C78_1715270 [compost metagenome]
MFCTIIVLNRFFGWVTATATRSCSRLSGRIEASNSCRLIMLRISSRPMGPALNRLTMRTMPSILK